MWRLRVGYENIAKAYRDIVDFNASDNVGRVDVPLVGFKSADLEVNFKTKEIKMEKVLIEKPIHIGVDGKETEYEDMQELIGVLSPLNTEFVEFSHTARARVLDLIGEDDESLGTVYQPFPSEYEGSPYANDMAVKAVEKKLADHVETRKMMNDILGRAKEGFWDLEIDLDALDGDYENQKRTWNEHLKPTLMILKYSIGIDGSMVRIKWEPDNAETNK